mmetsp:Transcript_33565/g.57046  ORF Transcript_33565/g.57046 Transcript_33565/m.57046 type:complete len:243 (-) Transcript_33565:68-796(-)
MLDTGRMPRRVIIFRAFFSLRLVICRSSSVTAPPSGAFSCCVAFSRSGTASPASSRSGTSSSSSTSTGAAAAAAVGASFAATWVAFASAFLPAFGGLPPAIALFVSFFFSQSAFFLPVWLNVCAISLLYPPALPPLDRISDACAFFSQSAFFAAVNSAAFSALACAAALLPLANVSFAFIWPSFSFSRSAFKAAASASGVLRALPPLAASSLARFPTAPLARRAASSSATLGILTSIELGIS